MTAGESDRHGRGWPALLLGVAVLALVWLLVLPAIGSLPGVRARIDEEQSRGINPGAMFYTELEAMREVEDRLDRAHRDSGATFWSPSWGTRAAPPE